MQALAYTFNEPNLKEMYFNLLTTASDARREGDAHPAFAEIIKQLSADETKVLSTVLAQETGESILLKMVEEGSTNYAELQKHIIPLLDDNGEPVAEKRTALWVDNWIRLGLVEVTYTAYLTGPKAYEWIDKRPEYIYASSSLPQPQWKLDVDRGVIEATDLGEAVSLPQ